MKDAHEKIQSLADELLNDGHAPEEIVDALLVVGINGGLQLSGAAQMSKFLRDTAEQLESGRSLSTSIQ